LASFSKNKPTKKHINNKKIGIILISFFSTLLFLTVFNILPFLNSLLLGTFGLFTYAILLTFLILGVMLLINKKTYLEIQDVVFMLIWLSVFICILQLISTTSFIDNGFSNYIKQCYSSKTTAGGILFGVIVYPIFFVTHLIGAYTILSICLTALTAILIDRFYAYKQFTKLNLKNKTEKANNSEFIDNVKQNNNVDTNLNPIKKVMKEKFDDDVIISDEKFSEIKKSKEIPISLDDEEKNKARQILGLSDKEKEINKNILSKKTENEFNYNEAKNKGMDRKDYILTPKFPDTKKDVNEIISEINPITNRPPKIVHNDVDANNKDVNLDNKLTDTDKKNLEFLRALKGDYVNLFITCKSCVFRFFVYINKFNAFKPNTINNDVEDDGLSNILNEINNNKDLYDPTLTLKNYDKKFGSELNNLKPTQIKLDGIDAKQPTKKAYNKPSKYVKPPIDL
jgi:hypothetical protein